MNGQHHNGDVDQQHHQQHQPQQHPVQRLPNECLYLIVHHLRDDLRTLHTLLLVSRFFFHAALPVLMDNPFDTWDMNGCSPRFPTNQDKLFALFLASLLHHQQELTGKEAASILAEFGLQLVAPAKVSFFEPFMTLTQEQEHNAGSVVQRRNPMTVDYSKYLTVLYGLQNAEWYYIKHYQFVRLIEMPEHLQRGEEDSDDNSEAWEAEDDYNGNNNDEHPVRLQLNSDYKDVLFSNYNRLLLQYNVDSITLMSFHVSEAHQYLPMATRLASLRGIVLTKSKAIPEEHLQDTVAFIRTNRTAFLRKPPLRLEFSRGWSCNDTSEFTSIAQSRTLVSDCMTALVELYRAVGEPEELDAHIIPEFYKTMEDVGTERLLRLSDSDNFRIDVGEGADMEAFLRRCPRLHTLALNIGHPFILSWAAREARDRADEYQQFDSPRTLLPRLDHLDLGSGRPYRFDIHALNDGMTAFSQTLTNVNLKNSHGFRVNDREEEAWFLDRDLDLSRQIRMTPLANTIGDWPFLLPQLRSLDIYIRCAGSLQVGSFDQCPNLEELSLHYGVVGSGPRAVEPNDQDPEHDVDPRRQAPLDPRMFPKWTLPKLKELMLWGAPAMLFNYDSLEEMTLLGKLMLAVDRKTDLQKLSQDIPRLSTYTNRFYAPMPTGEAAATSTIATTIGIDNASSTESFENFIGTGPATSFGNDVWRGTWKLPLLKDLDLRGPPATAFTFDLLKRFPSLVSLFLKLPYPGPYQRLPLVTFTPVTAAELGSDGDDAVTIKDIPWGGEVNMGSKLEKLGINGSWNITSADLVALLTEHAPFLKEFSLQLTRMSTAKFFDAFRDADEMLRRRFGPEWDARPTAKEDSALSSSLQHKPLLPLPGRSLVDVFGNCHVGGNMPVDYMEMIDPDEADDYRQLGIRVFDVSCLYFVHERDGEWFKTVRRGTAREVQLCYIFE
ncbi:MAG: hypothetical protein JOS17DRAFT_798988 [Linnemannia elongata]|nr:MAG: hypothetical protein JOS17DRAFT_798988 [Linnemannia elongata]